MDKVTCTLTREQFVQQEIELARSKVMFTEDLDTDVLDAIQKRAEWNAQAAERAGVIWRQEQEQEPEDDTKWPAGRRVLWSVPAKDGFSAFRILADGAVQYSWAETEHGWFDLRGTKYGESIHPAMQELARVLVAEHQAKQQVAKSYTHNPWLQEKNSSVTPDLDNWADCPNVSACGNKVCLWAGTGLCHPCSVRDLGKKEMDSRYEKTHREPKLEPATEFQVPDALTMDIIERVNQHGSRLDQHKASIAQLAEDQKILIVRVNVQDVRLAEIDRRLESAQEGVRELRDMGQRAFDRLDKIEGPVLQGVQNVTLGLGNKIDNLNLAVASLIGRVCKLESGEVAEEAEGKGDPK